MPAAIVPVVVGTAAAVDVRHVRWAPFLAALLAALLIQIGTNFANDVFDFLRGADTHARLGPPRITQSGIVSPRRVLAVTAGTFGLAAVLGLYLISVGGMPILIIGAASILSGIAYTAGPYPLGYHGLGDLFAFVFFGPVAVMGSAYLQVHEAVGRAALASVPVGCLVTAILVVNNVRDIDTDREAGKRTLAVRLGRGGTRAEYVALLALAYAVTPFLGWWTLLPWLTLPRAVGLAMVVRREIAGPPLVRALQETGRLHLGFGLLLAGGLWL